MAEQPAVGGHAPPPEGQPPQPAQQEELAKHLEPSSYRLWIAVGIALFAVGMIVSGFGEMFSAGTGGQRAFVVLGGFAHIPGSVLLTAGLAVGALTDDRLSNGVRMGALIVAGVLALVVL